jgi:LmbE family N-acetylglucosaminyl deacetylase
MKKIIFGIFAHPDDEAFIVAGTLLKETQAGSQVHLICLTDGASGTNPDNDNVANLGEARLEEWRRAGQLLGAASMHYLGYSDGQLNNLALLEVAGKIEAIVHELAYDGQTQIEFMAFDFNGLTGHIDHIVASRAAALAFYQLKANDSRFTKLRLACLPETLYPTTNVDWLYMEAGQTAGEIDETVDARDMRDKILEVIHTHHSQRHDGETMIKTFGDQLGLNYFVVKE